MERHRDIRRGNMAAAAAANGLSRRRPRSSASTTTSNSFRDSPEENGTAELHETTRLRDRAGKKERDRLNRNKRRRGERLMLGGHDGGDESSEDSIDEDDDDEDDESSHMRMRPPNPASSSHSNHHLHRKSFPPAAAKVVRATTWKVSDEMSFSVPKRARSACTKRAHETYVSVVGGSGGGSGSVAGGNGEQVHRQASTSTSPARLSPAPTAAPASPSSSTASVRKKLKPMGAKPKHKPPKPSGVQDDIEIEVAEVLYGLLRQSQCPSRQEAATNCSSRHDSRDANGSGNDAASPLLSKLPQNSSSTTTPVSAVAPKRKRPRPVKFEDEHSPDFANKNDSMNKIEDEQPTKTEASSTKLDKDSGSNQSPNGISLDFCSSQTKEAPLDVQQGLKTESNSITEAKAVGGDSIVRSDDQINSSITTTLKKESSCSKAEIDARNATTTNASPASVAVSRREENFKIDLMAPPSKSSPERDGEIGSAALDSKPMASDTDMKIEHRELKEKENAVINSNRDNEAVAPLEKKREEASVEECASQKESAAKHTMVDPQIDSEKDNNNNDCGPNNVRQQQLHTQQQHQSKTTRNEPKLDIAAQSISSAPLPMNITGWPSGLTPMGNGIGQVQFQGMASLDGTPGSSNPIQPPHQLTQPRPKRCATHYYIARNIYYHQQFTKMNPFWPAAAAGAASLYGNKSYNLNVMPPTETAIIGNPLLGNLTGKSLSSMQDRGQVEGTKDKSSVATNSVDATQGKIPKQMVLQQPPQAVIQGPAFIFPPNHQQAAVSSGLKNGVANVSNTTNATPSPAVQSTPGTASAAGSAAISYSYPNMGNTEAQYVAILQNNGYPFPVPAHVGPASSYRGAAPPAMPFYNGPVYSSQVMHPAQLQQQQQLQQHQMQQSHSQQQPSQQGHQNTSTSSGSSSSQKHQQQNQQQRLQASGSNAAANGASNSIAASKNRAQKQQSQPFPLANQVRQHDSDMAFEDSSTAEANRNSQAHKNTYSHNFAMPMQAKNYASSLSSAGLANGGNGYHNERPQQQQHQSSKGGTESGPNQTFAMPYTSFNGGTAISGLDFSSIAQNHVIFQSLPEAARHGYQIAAAAAAAQTAQQKKNHQTLEEGKAVSDSNNAEEERKATAGKGQPSGAQAIVFSRTDPSDPSASTILGNSVVESSARTLNLISSPGNGNRSSRANTSTAAVPTSTTVTASYSQQQQHQQQQHLQQKQMGQFMQMQQFQQMQIIRQQQQMHQQMAAAAATRGKPSTTSGASVYTDSLSSSSSMAAKFSNTQYFPESLIQGGSPNQSPQWKNTRPAVSSSSSPSLASATSSSLKNLSQQQGRTQQGHTQISFGVNSKQGNVQQGQQISAGNQSPSSPVVVGSPPTSISKSAGGSPRASSMGNKLVSAPSLSSQQSKTSSSGPSRKSSPVGGRNPPSNLGNSHINLAPCSTAKASQSHHQQTLQQQQQQQQQKHALQQAQLYFSNAHMQAQSPQSNSTTGNNAVVLNNVYYQQRRQPPDQQQQQQQLGSSNTSSGMLSLCPLTLASSTSDPTKAVAAANMKGGLPPAGLIQAAQFANQSGGHPFMSTAFPYIHSVSSAQVKPAEQKQPAGNDNLHAYSQPEKR